MASQADIANVALTTLGKPTLTSLNDGSTASKAILALYDVTRRMLLEGRPVWNFAVRRASLPSLVGTPASGPFTTIYALPADHLRPLQIGDTWPGLDLTDYRQGPTDADYAIEGNQILCDYGSPLSIQYVADITDTTKFDAAFVFYFGARLAYDACERITNSTEKQAAAEKRMDEALRMGAASNAYWKAPIQQADDSWVLARLQ